MTASVAMPAIRFDAMAGNTFQRLGGDVEAGQMARVTYADEEQRDELWDVLTGLRAPRRGQLSFAGRDLYSLPASQRLAVFQRVAVVPHGGGLISNLRAWENMVLPVWYHRACDIAELEQPVVQWLTELGMDERRMRELTRRLPEQLHASERAMVALVRALLIEPDIILCSAPFSGVERDTAARMLRAITQYHRAGTGRVALWLLPDEPLSDRVPVDVTLTLEN